MNMIIRTNDESLMSSLLAELPPKGITVSIEEVPGKGMIDTGDVVNIAISAAISVPTSLFAQWLWSKIKGTDQLSTNIIINNKKVEIRQTAIYQELHTHCVHADEDPKHKTGD